MNGHGPKKQNGTTTPSTRHPLDPLSAAEIETASKAIREHLATSASGPAAHKSAYITLIEPPKAEVVAYLGIACSPISTSTATTGKLPARMAESAVIDSLTGQVRVFEVEVVKDAGKVVSETVLPDGVQPGITMEELLEAEEVVRKDARVQELCANVGESSAFCTMSIRAECLA